MSSVRLAAALAIAAALAGCGMWPRPAPGQGGDPLITNPAGTVDTTHGAEGVQASPH